MNPVERISSVGAGRTGAALSGILLLVLAAGLLAPAAARAQVPECAPVHEFILDPICVAPGQEFDPIDLAALLDVLDPNHPAVADWEITETNVPPPPDVTLDGSILTAQYPEGFLGCREVRVVAWAIVNDAYCMYARFWVWYNVAPSPVVADIPHQYSDPGSPDCDVVTLNLDDYLSGGVDPNQVEWTYTGNSQLDVTIDPNTHQATVTNSTGADVTETITFEVCLILDEPQQPESDVCLEYCWQCASVDVTFTLACETAEPLLLSKDDGLDEDECVEPDGLLTYEICFANPNDFSVYQVSLVDTLPFYASFVSATDGGVYDPNAGIVSWSVGLLDPNDAKCVELVVQVSPDAPPGGMLYNVVTITGTRDGVADNSDPVDPLASVAETLTDICLDLHLTKDDGLDEEEGECVVAGDQINYEICFDNLCRTELAAAVEPVCRIPPAVLVDMLPDEVVFVSASDGGVYDPNSHTVTWNFEPTDTDSDRTCVQLVVEVGADVVPGSTLTNVARLSLVLLDVADVLPVMAGPWEVSVDTDVCEPPPEPQPCPECPDNIETRAVGFFCPSAATIMLTLATVGIVALRRRRI